MRLCEDLFFALPLQEADQDRRPRAEGAGRAGQHRPPLRRQDQGLQAHGGHHQQQPGGEIWMSFLSYYPIFRKKLVN